MRKKTYVFFQFYPVIFTHNLAPVIFRKIPIKFRNLPIKYYGYFQKTVFFKLFYVHFMLIHVRFFRIWQPLWICGWHLQPNFRDCFTQLEFGSYQYMRIAIEQQLAMICSMKWEKKNNTNHTLRCLYAHWIGVTNVSNNNFLFSVLHTIGFWAPNDAFLRDNMSLERAGSGATMLSRAWSTSDLGRGLTHILTDGKNELPDDLAQLEAFWAGWL